MNEIFIIFNLTIDEFSMGNMHDAIDHVYIGIILYIYMCLIINCSVICTGPVS